MNPAPVPWEVAIEQSLRKLALTLTAVLAAASVVWQFSYRRILYDFVFRPTSIEGNSLKARQAFFPILGVAAVIALALCVRVIWRARRAKGAPSLHWEILGTSCVVLPMLTVPAVEFEHALFTTVLTVIFGTALAWAVSREASRFRGLPDISRRQAQVLVGAGFITFVGTVGFIAYWRYLTFHAPVCDTSYEVNAVAGILRHGIPTLSIAAFFYNGQPLPGPYFVNHVPLVDYLFAPFFALYQKPSTVIWMQTVFMGGGTFGGYLIGRKWLDSRLGGVLFAWLYLLCPNVQGFCLHDVHANVLIIPCLVLAVGLMEAGCFKWALTFALLSAICREEAPVYAAGLGLYWLFAAEGDRWRRRSGLGLVLVAGALQVFFSAYLMPHFGGHPRLDHFDFFYLRERSMGSMLAAVFLNPLGGLYTASGSIKLDYLAISLVSTGGIALLGWRAGWFAVPALLLLLPSGDPGFFSLGSNYSAPLVPAVLLMGFAGIRRVWHGANQAMWPRRVGIVTYVLTTALIANYLYGDIASKSYKFEYGQAPVRRENQRNYQDIVSYLDVLPPFGAAERALWEVIERVPKNVPVATTWAVNAQLSHYDIALELGYSGGSPAPEERVRYVVIDKLPALVLPTEPYIAHFRRESTRWKVFYENASGVIFERR